MLSLRPDYIQRMFETIDLEGLKNTPPAFLRGIISRERSLKIMKDNTRLKPKTFGRCYNFLNRRRVVVDKLLELVQQGNSPLSLAPACAAELDC